MLRSILLLGFFTISLFSLAQNGTINGSVTDAKSGEVVIGANVMIQGTSVGSSTDIEGKFSIPNLKPGTYTLSVTFITYKAHTIPDVVVEAGKVSTIQVQMQEDVSTLKEVVISGTREINTDVSLLSAIKASKLVVSGISSEQIAKLPDNDAAQVMKRVPGITIVDNRFVMVRGVPERYNVVMINGAIAPSTEIDKRSFSFDLIPAGAIDQLLIYKSGAADLPGDFAGGVIQLVTKETVAEDFTSVGLNFGYRSGTSFKKFLESKKSPTDFLGFDNGMRDLPSNFPSTAQLSTYSIANRELAAAGQSLSNDFDISSGNAPVDMGMNLGLGRNFTLGKINASTIASLGYSNSYLTVNNATFRRYATFDVDPSTPSVAQQDFLDDGYLHESKINFVNNWRFRVGDRTKIDFKNMLVQIGENKMILREGTDIGSQLGLYNNYAYHYLSRFIYSGQLEGAHESSNGMSNIRWVVGYNHIDRNEPDFRRFRRIKGSNDTDFRMILPPGSNPFDAGRFYSDLNDNGYTHGLSFERKLRQSDEKRVPLVKAGYLVDYKQRDYSARYISYTLPGALQQLEGELAGLPINQIFSPSNMYGIDETNAYKPGFALKEGTRPTDNYKGKSVVAAGYASGSVPFGKFDVTAGVRVEYFNQQMTVSGAQVAENIKTTPLPFINAAYNISDRSLLRLAYGRTVNRPEFRELAPFLFYQFEYNLNISGNPNLKTATVDNIDLRWEMYPNPGEAISVGAFYKSFKNPIEFVQQNASGGLQFNYSNAPEAMNYGVELEVRKSLSSLGVSKFLRNTSLNLNTSLIKSQVNFPDSLTFQQNKRSLQGQSPYVINGGMYYNDPDKGYSVNVAYNVFGNRIFSAGSVLFPTWIERPRQSLDIQLAKQFKNNMEVKFNIANVLNSAYRLYQDNDENEKIDERIDDPVQVYKTGTLYSLTWNWKFLKQ